jgi:hypothetical protein
MKSQTSAESCPKCGASQPSYYFHRSGLCYDCWTPALPILSRMSAWTRDVTRAANQLASDSSPSGRAIRYAAVYGVKSIPRRLRIGKWTKALRASIDAEQYREDVSDAAPRSNRLGAFRAQPRGPEVLWWPAMIARRWPAEYRQVVLGLHARQQLVFRQFHRLGMTQGEIAAEQGWSQSRVSAIVAQIDKRFVEAGLPEPQRPDEQRAMREAPLRSAA